MLDKGMKNVVEGRVKLEFPSSNPEPNQTPAGWIHHHLLSYNQVEGYLYKVHITSNSKIVLDYETIGTKPSERTMN
jgi:hypothetical protein